MIARSFILALVVLPICAYSNPTSAQLVFESPYAQWVNGPSTDSEFFPIGVWLQDPKLALQYKSAGINLYVGLWQGPTEGHLADLQEAGMRVICSQNAVGLKHLDDPTIAGWLQRDEPDNVPTVPRPQLLAEYDRMRQNDPTRPILLNFGQGVANREFMGRGVPYSYYREAIGSCDIASFDVYPVAGVRSVEKLWYVAKGVDSLKVWGHEEKPVWNFIETTRIKSSKFKPTPQQVKAEVWMSLIHGSQGIMYFAHEWEPRFDAARLLHDAEILSAVTAINAQIHGLAPVLNGPTIRDGLDITSSSAEVPIDAMVKRHEEQIYLFAVPMRLGPTRATFQFHDLEGALTAEVIDEERSIPLIDGRLEDDFDTYEVHLYKISPPATTAIESENSAALPPALTLEPSYPNPFNGATAIPFFLPVGGEVQLDIFDLVGQRVTTLASGTRRAGAHTIYWNGRAEDDHQLPSGAYLCRLQLDHGQQVETRKLMLVR